MVYERTIEQVFSLLAVNKADTCGPGRVKHRAVEAVYCGGEGRRCCQISRLEQPIKDGCTADGGAEQAEHGE